MRVSIISISHTSTCKSFRNHQSIGTVLGRDQRNNKEDKRFCETAEVDFFSTVFYDVSLDLGFEKSPYSTYRAWA